jgi:hypothetical protein
MQEIYRLSLIGQMRRRVFFLDQRVNNILLMKNVLKTFIEKIKIIVHTQKRDELISNSK